MTSYLRKIFGAAAIFGLLAALPCAAEELTGSAVPIDETHFPDAVLRALVAEEDMDGDGILSRSESKYLSSLWLTDTDLVDLSGVELLPGLKSIYCNNTLITAADLSGCTRLESFSAYDCAGLAEIKLPVGIEDVDVSNSALTAIDVSGCPVLERLSVNGNKLTALDVSACTELQSLAVSDNKLTELDLASCTALEYLYVSQNKLAVLDVTGLTELNSFYADENSLTGTLDFSGLDNLRNLSLDDNGLTTLTVNDCPALESLSCTDNKLTALTVSGCPKLKWFYAYGNKLDAVDLSGSPELTRSNALLDDGCRVRYGSLLGLDWKELLLIARVAVGIGAVIAGIIWLVRRLASNTHNR